MAGEGGQGRWDAAPKVPRCKVPIPRPRRAGGDWAPFLNTESPGARSSDPFSLGPLPQVSLQCCGSKRHPRTDATHYLLISPPNPYIYLPAYLTPSLFLSTRHLELHAVQTELLISPHTFSSGLVHPRNCGSQATAAAVTRDSSASLTPTAILLAGPPNISRIPLLLTTFPSSSLDQVAAISCLDYYSSLFPGLSASPLAPLSSILYTKTESSQ